MQPVATYPVDAAANLRRSVIVASGLGIASIVALSFIGHELMGVFFCVGLSLGAINNRMLQGAVARYGSDMTITKGRFTRRVFVRLAAITALAVVIALFDRPDGLGVFAGLAVFQVLMLVGASVPVFRSLRQQ
ncbi:MAG: hypothetical protein JO147_06740 [Actinobacteria bacterium]|nr:hypothetical protein [Actinomycetota bacterium]